jgi:hypothetical protein
MQGASVMKMRLEFNEGDGLQIDDEQTKPYHDKLCEVSETLLLTNPLTSSQLACLRPSTRSQGTPAQLISCLTSTSTLLDAQIYSSSFEGERGMMRLRRCNLGMNIVSFKVTVSYLVIVIRIQLLSGEIGVFIIQLARWRRASRFEL